MKKLPGFLRKHCVAFLVGALAVLVAFGQGWYANADHVTAQRETELCDQMRWLAENVGSLQNQYKKRARTGELDDAINTGNQILISALRSYAGVTLDALIDLNSPPIRTHQEAVSYLHFLSTYLLAAEYPDYHALEELFAATWPLIEVSFSDLNEALDAITEHLSTQQGEAALDIVAGLHEP